MKAIVASASFFSTILAQTTPGLITPCISGEPGCLTTVETYPDLTTPCSPGEEGCEVTEQTLTTIKENLYNECGSLKLQTGDSGEFSSKNYPNAYPTGVSCVWNIEVDEKSAISIFVDHNYYIQPADNCKRGYLQFVDFENSDSSNLNTAEKNCQGYDYPGGFRSVGNKLSVYFSGGQYSDSDNVGFKLKWFKIGKNDNVCGSEKNQRGTSGVIESVNYPNHYFNMTVCKWNIEVEWPNQIIISPNFENFEIGRYDSLVAIDPYTGDKTYFSESAADGLSLNPDTSKLISFREKLNIEFKSNSENSHTGFQLKWFEHKVAEINTCGSKSLLKEENATIQSMNYPNNYENNADCEWFIEVDEGSKIQVNFEQSEFDLADYYEWAQVECEHDYLLFEEPEKNSHRFCHKPENFITEGNRLQVTFKSDQFGTAKGFRFSYVELKNDTGINLCGSEIEQRGLSGEFSSFNYPSTYAMDIDCEWNVKVDPGMIIKVQIEESKASSNCSLQNSDYLKIGTENDPQTSSFCSFNELSGQILKSMGNQLDFKFLRNENNKFSNYNAFKVKWWAEPASEICESKNTTPVQQIIPAGKTGILSDCFKTEENDATIYLIAEHQDQNFVFTSEHVIGSGCIQIDALGNNEESNDLSSIKICSEHTVFSASFSTNQTYKINSNLAKISFDSFKGSYSFVYNRIDNETKWNQISGIYNKWDDLSLENYDCLTNYATDADDVVIGLHKKEYTDLTEIPFDFINSTAGAGFLNKYSIDHSHSYSAFLNTCSLALGQMHYFTLCSR